MSSVRVALLQAVAVDDDAQRRSRPKCAPVMAASHMRALLQLAVAENDEGASTGGPSSWPARAVPTATGKPWPSGPVFVSTPGDLGAVRVAVEPGERGHEGGQLRHVEEARAMASVAYSAAAA